MHYTNYRLWKNKQTNKQKTNLPFHSIISSFLHNLWYRIENQHIRIEQINDYDILENIGINTHYTDVAG